MNVALGKPAKMSSSRYYLSTAAMAVDGSSATGSSAYDVCAQTQHLLTRAGSWWLVDLEAVYVINTVVIYYRKTCCGKRDIVM